MTNYESNKDLHDEIIELSDGSIVQHGRYNDRIYLMKMSNITDEEFPSKLIDLAFRKKYTKIFAKIPGGKLADFIENGFSVEAVVPGFYVQDDGYFIAFYLDSDREKESSKDQLNQIRDYSLSKRSAKSSKIDKSKYAIRICNENDITKMANLYQTVFSSYPFPISDPEYLLETMNSHVEYYCVEDIKNGGIVSLSSAEIDFKSRIAEMTDFATHPKMVGNGFAVHLLSMMENNLKIREIQTFYTIARAQSYAMNITFVKSGYEYAGRLKNNTNISGNIESMNVWYKSVNTKE